LTNAITTSNTDVIPWIGEANQIGKDIMENTSEYLDSLDLEQLTGTPASTWRYWAHIGTGPASFKLGRRRVWKRSTVLAWLESQETAPA
jgi:predicted DNA-binding transcriptional regulator AlpA